MERSAGTFSHSDNGTEAPSSTRTSQIGLALGVYLGNRGLRAFVRRLGSGRICFRSLDAMIPLYHSSALNARLAAHSTACDALQPAWSPLDFHRVSCQVY